MGRMVIYTCITDGYDSLMQPEPSNPDFDFICFTAPGGSPGRDGVWELRPLSREYGDGRMTSRYPKMHPHVLLPEYEYSLWVDGNIRIVNRGIYDTCKTLAADGAVYAGVPHPYRDCLYAEAWMAWRLGKANLGELLRVWSFMAMHHFPLHAGLMECGIIFRRHSDSRVIAMDNLWWKMIHRLSGRDQTSHMWCMKECEVPFRSLFADGIGIRNTSWLEYLEHNDS